MEIEPTFYLDGQPYVWGEGTFGNSHAEIIEKAIHDTQFAMCRMHLNMMGLLELPEEHEQLNEGEFLRRLTEMTLGVSKLLALGTPTCGRFFRGLQTCH